MSASTPEQIVATFSMTADDYARYFAIGRRLDAGWANFIAYIVMLSGAIPVALVFRFIGAQSFDDPAAVASIGYSSLFAFMLGVFAAVAVMVVMRRAATSKALKETLNAFGLKTAVFDATTLTMKGQLSEASWRWGAVNRFLHESGLFLIWVGGQTPVVIPSRAFGSDSACMAADAFIRARMTEAVQPADRAKS